MKKLIAMAVMLGAASVFADTFSSDSYLYWMIGNTGSYSSWSTAKAHVVGTETYLTIGVEGVASDAKSIASSAYDSDFNLWSSLAGIDNGKSIVIELFNDQGGWLATSDALALNSAAQYITDNRMGIGMANAWTATNFGIPEPNSAVLMLVGAALLGLKRKRAKKA